jgi:hypothetical protein
MNCDGVKQVRLREKRFTGVVYLLVYPLAIATIYQEASGTSELGREERVTERVIPSPQ